MDSQFLFLHASTRLLLPAYTSERLAFIIPYTPCRGLPACSLLLLTHMHAATISQHNKTSSRTHADSGEPEAPQKCSQRRKSRIQGGNKESPKQEGKKGGWKTETKIQSCLFVALHSGKRKWLLTLIHRGVVGSHSYIRICCYHTNALLPNTQHSSTSRWRRFPGPRSFHHQQ